MLGWQAAGAAPLVLGEPVPHPETIATAIRIGNPASWDGRDRRPRRVGRPHRRGHRRRDPRRLPVARADGGLLRRAGVGGVGRRAAPGGRRRAGRAPTRPSCARVTGPRPEGPEPRDRRGRRSGRRGRRQRPTRWPPSSACEPGGRDMTMGKPVALVTGASAGIGARVRAQRRRLAATTSCSSLATRPGSRSSRKSSRREHGTAVEVLAADLTSTKGIAVVEARLDVGDRPVDLARQQRRLRHVRQVRRARRRGRGPGDPAQRGRAGAAHACRAAGDGSSGDGAGSSTCRRSRATSRRPINATYAATKAFVTSFTQRCTRSSEGRASTCMVLCPGFTRTEFQERAGLDAGACRVPVAAPEPVVDGGAARLRPRARGVLPRRAQPGRARCSRALTPAGITRRHRAARSCADASGVTSSGGVDALESRRPATGRTARRRGPRRTRSTWLPSHAEVALGRRARRRRCDEARGSCRRSSR